MKLTFTDAEIQATAEDLGVVQAGEPVPAAARSRVVATLLQERKPAAPTVEPQLAGEVVVQPGGSITIDGEPFPWLVAREPMAISLNPEGVSTVRLALMASAVQVIKPVPVKEDPQS